VPFIHSFAGISAHGTVDLGTNVPGSGTLDFRSSGHRPWVAPKIRARAVRLRAQVEIVRAKIAASGRNVPSEGTFLPLVEILIPGWALDFAVRVAHFVVHDLTPDLCAVFI
jgi:hypothetical protein